MNFNMSMHLLQSAGLSSFSNVTLSNYIIGKKFFDLPLSVKGGKNYFFKKNRIMTKENPIKRMLQGSGITPLVIVKTSSPL